MTEVVHCLFAVLGTMATAGTTLVIDQTGRKTWTNESKEPPIFSCVY